MASPVSVTPPASSPPRQGRVLVIAGPSGSGKSTLVERLLRQAPVLLSLAISATTRKPRDGEVHGRDYFFLSQAEFDARRDRGEFLECAEVHGRGHWYGTLRSEVERGLAAGRWVLLEIDIQGTRVVRELFPDAVTIFIRLGSMEELEQRLRGRGTEDEAEVQRRLETARHEMREADQFQYQVVNARLDEAVAEICRIVAAEAGK